LVIFVQFLLYAQPKYAVEKLDQLPNILGKSALRFSDPGVKIRKKCLFDMYLSILRTPRHFSKDCRLALQALNNIIRSG